MAPPVFGVRRRQPIPDLRCFKRRIHETPGRSRGIAVERRLDELRHPRPRFDGLLRAGLAVETVRQTRSVNSTPFPEVPLERLAVPPHTPPGANPSRCSASSSDPARSQPQMPLADGQNHRQRRWDDQGLARRTKLAQHEPPMGTACSASSNRVVRTRTLPGVGAGTGDRPGYPIYIRFRSG